MGLQEAVLDLAAGVILSDLGIQQADDTDRGRPCDGQRRRASCPMPGTPAASRSASAQ